MIPSPFQGTTEMYWPVYMIVVQQPLWQFNPDETLLFQMPEILSRSRVVCETLLLMKFNQIHFSTSLENTCLAWG